MMTKHYGGEKVAAGIYFSRRDLEFITVPAEGGRLDGSRRDLYVKTPAAFVLIAGPVMGLVFAFFLPLSGLLVLVPFLMGKLRDALTPATARMATVPVAPGVSYLEGAASSRSTQTDDSAASSGLIHLAEEIAARRSRDIDSTKSSS